MEARSDLQSIGPCLGPWSLPLSRYPLALCDYPALLASSLTSDIVTSSTSWRNPRSGSDSPSLAFCALDFYHFLVTASSPVVSVFCVPTLQGLLADWLVFYAASAFCWPASASRL